jgi:hypothetical protein
MSAIALTAVIGIGLAPSPTARSPIATTHDANQLHVRTLGYTVIPDAGISHLVDGQIDKAKNATHSF